MKRHASFEDVISAFSFVSRLLVELGTSARSQLAVDEVERCECDECVLQEDFRPIESNGKIEDAFVTAASIAIRPITDVTKESK